LAIEFKNSTDMFVIGYIAQRYKNTLLIEIVDTLQSANTGSLAKSVEMA